MILKRMHNVNRCRGELGTMHRAKRVSIAQFNQHLVCVLCKGYFIDATTIIQCLHSFCRSCIVQYLEKNKYCPVCDVQVHKTKPLINLRQDKTLQAIVYKLVPGLYHNETQRRKEYYEAHPEAKPSSHEENEEATYQYLLTPQETICVSLTYHDCKATPRYLKCPAAVSVAHLIKLICAKYELTEQHKVDILYNQDSLLADLTLVDVACIYLWKKKGPMELTYRIYEKSVKRIKLEEKEQGDEEQSVMNNNDWKEVQLRISENGEMSITGIQDSIEDIMSEQGIMEKLNCEKEIEEKPILKPKMTKKAAKKEMPGLKVIEKGKNKKTEAKKELSSTKEVKDNQKNDKTESEKKVDNENIKTNCNNGNIIKEKAAPEKMEVDKQDIVKSNDLLGKSISDFPKISSELTIEPIPNEVEVNKQPAKSLLSSSTNILRSGNSTNSKDALTVTKITETDTEKMEMENTSQKNDCKHKLESSNLTEVGEPPIKQAKPTILNHSLKLQSFFPKKTELTEKHTNLNKSKTVDKPLNKNAGLIKNAILNKSANADQNTNFEVDKSVDKNANTDKNKTVPINKNSQLNISTNKSLEEEKWAQKTKFKPPFYTPPKPPYSPIINIPKVQAGPSTQRYGDALMKRVNMQAQASLPQANTSQNLPQSQPVKTKNSNPLGYTLRNPPKSWNPQISRENLKTPVADPKYTDTKNIRPAKFFKMRNNVPRYLGNPASGVKPMYQVHVSPEKKNETTSKEIKKHSIVKIDPKTLKPISERAPDTSNLSNQSDLKINTSSVSIFNPLKLQSSPKNERKSPKSPHSPNKKSVSPPNKREKLNLSFTPSNPFIPNLGSPNINPNQFLYPAPGFPSYDPRVMAAYHSFMYGQRFPFPNPLLDTQNARNSLDLLPQTSTKLPGVSLPPNHGLKMGSGTMTQANSLKTQLVVSSASNSSNLNMSPSILGQATQAKGNLQTGKKLKDTKPEKSLLNTLEKLSQNRAKENLSRLEANAKSSTAINELMNQGKEVVKNPTDKSANEKSALGTPKNAGENTKNNLEVTKSVKNSDEVTKKITDNNTEASKKDMPKTELNLPKDVTDLSKKQLNNEDIINDINKIDKLAKNTEVATSKLESSDKNVTDASKTKGGLSENVDLSKTNENVLVDVKLPKSVAELSNSTEELPKNDTNALKNAEVSKLNENVQDSVTAQFVKEINDNKIQETVKNDTVGTDMVFKESHISEEKCLAKNEQSDDLKSEKTDQEASRKSDSLQTSVEASK